MYRNIHYYIMHSSDYPTTKQDSSYEYYDSKTSFKEMAFTMKDNLDAGSSIALVPVGTIGYFTDFTIFDMVGKVDETIAHEPFVEEYIKSWRPGHDKGDGDYILNKEPDYLLLHSILTREPMDSVDGFDLQYKSVVEIWNSAEFKEDYMFFPVKLKSGWYINLWHRVD